MLRALRGSPAAARSSRARPMLTLAFLAPLLFAPQGTPEAPPQDAPASSAAAQDADLFAPLDTGWNVDVGGALKLGVMWSDDVDFYGTDGTAAFSLAAARLWVDSELSDEWRLHIGLRGEKGNPRAYVGAAGEPGEVRTVDTYAAYRIDDGWDVLLGKFRPPFASSGMLEEEGTLFFDRSIIGEKWDFYDTGAMLRGQVGPLRGWLSAQNGADGSGNNAALTGRGMWDVVGGGVEHEYEGGWNAPEGLALSVGGAVYYDTSTDNLSAQSLELAMTFSPVYLAAEVADEGNGLGSLYAYSLTGSVMLAEDIELAARLEGFNRADNTDLFRATLNKYLRGHDAKWQLSYSSSKSNAPLVDSQILVLGLTLAF